MASLKKNIGASFVGNIVYALSQWLLLIILAKLGGEKVIGVYALALAVVSPIFSLGNMNLRAVQATDTEAGVCFTSYARFRHLTSLISILVCFSVAALVYRGNLDTCLSIFCLAIYKYFESQSDLVHGYLQKMERMDLIAYSIMLRGFFNLIIIGTAYYFTHDLVQALALSIIKSWMIYFIYDARNFRRLDKGDAHLSKTSLELFKIAWPLGIVIFANTLNLNIPRYFIAEYYDEAMVGIFASISYFIVAGSTLVNAIGQSAIPRLAKYGFPNLGKFRLLSRQVFLLITLVGMIGVLIAEYLGEYILQMVYTATIADYYSLFVQIMWAGVAIYSSVAIGCSLTALRDFKSQSVFSIINMLIMLFSSWYLIREFGLPGAAAAIGLTHVIKLLMAWLRVRYLFGAKHLATL
jgi:O-antigen/teichoic acid export membrane protein